MSGKRPHVSRRRRRCRWERLCRHGGTIRVGQRARRISQHEYVHADCCPPPAVLDVWRTISGLVEGYFRQVAQFGAALGAAARQLRSSMPGPRHQAFVETGRRMVSSHSSAAAFVWPALGRHARVVEASIFHWHADLAYSGPHQEADRCWRCDARPGVDERAGLCEPCHTALQARTTGPLAVRPEQSYYDEPLPGD